jgi:hypothetical protein
MRRLAAAPAFGGLMLWPGSGHAVWTPGLPHTGPALRGGPVTEMIMSGTAQGRGVAGFIANPDNTAFDPVKDGYPTSNPTSGFTPQNDWFAGLIRGAPVSGGNELLLFCIDIHTLTDYGFGYTLGDWRSRVQIPAPRFKC